MRKNKAIILGFLGLIMTLLMVAVASALTLTVAMSNPLGSTTNSGTITLGAEVNGSIYLHNDGAARPGVANATNVSYQYSTDGSTFFVAAVNSSNADNGTYSSWNITFDTNNLSDAKTYTWRAVLTNETDTLDTSAEITGVLFDNMQPVVSLTSPVDGAIVEPGFAVAATCNNASSAVVILGGDEFAMTVSGGAGSETCAFTFGNDKPAKLTYNVVQIRAVDLGGVNISLTSGVSWTVDKRTGASKGVAIAADALSRGEEVRVGPGGTLSIGGQGAGLSNGFSAVTKAFTNNPKTDVPAIAVVGVAGAAGLGLLPIALLAGPPGLIVAAVALGVIFLI